MIKVKPSTIDADMAILKSVGDHPKVFKHGLLVHAAREIIARRSGYDSWDKLQAANNAESERFMRDLCANVVSFEDRHGVPGWVGEYVSGKV